MHLPVIALALSRAYGQKWREGECAMFMNDEGTMFDSLGEAVFAAFLESLRQMAPPMMVAGVLLVTFIILGAFVEGLFRAARVRDLELEHAEREVLLDLAHRGEPLP